MLRRSSWRWPRKFASWSIIAVFFFNIFSVTVLPALSSGEANAAFLQADSRDVLTICTPNGIKITHLNADGEPEPIEEGHVAGFCAFCLPFNNPILFASATPTVISERFHKSVLQPFIRDANQAATSVTSRPLGSRAPPTCS